jgi:hypothetical protein
VNQEDLGWSQVVEDDVCAFGRVLLKVAVGFETLEEDAAAQALALPAACGGTLSRAIRREFKGEWAAGPFAEALGFSCNLMPLEAARRIPYPDPLPVLDGERRRQ